VVVERALAAMLLLLSQVWMPLILIAVGGIILISPVMILLLGEGLHRELHTNPFEPGRWESRSGKYWVELYPDGTGAVLLPAPGTDSECGPGAEPWDGAVVWTYDDDSPTTLNLHVNMELPSHPDCAGEGPWLTGWGMSDEYDWHFLVYSRVDPESVDLRLRRVDG
jgi:hypothetical protein